MPTLITNNKPEEFGWKTRRQDKKTELYWELIQKKQGYLTTNESYQKKWNFKEMDYNHEPSNNGLDLMNPSFAFDKKLAKYIKFENSLRHRS